MIHTCSRRSTCSSFIDSVMHLIKTSEEMLRPDSFRSGNSHHVVFRVDSFCLTSFTQVVIRALDAFVAESNNWFFASITGHSWMKFAFFKSFCNKKVNWYIDVSLYKFLIIFYHDNTVYKSNQYLPSISPSILVMSSIKSKMDPDLTSLSWVVNWIWSL